MRFVVQVVSKSDVKIHGKIKGSIGKGTGTARITKAEQDSLKWGVLCAALGSIPGFIRMLKIRRGNIVLF